MAQRHIARSTIICVLYALDYQAADVIARADSPEEYIRTLITYIGQEFSGGNPDYSFVERVVLGVVRKKQILDDIIRKTAPKWPLEDMYIIDRNILRMSIYELLFERAHVPPKVAISEAVELARMYGGQANRKFINGVLGTIFRELQLTDDIDSTPVKLTETGDQLIEDYKAGGFVYAIDDTGGVHVALVKDLWGYWTFPKGEIEPNEDVQQACIREIKEEIGLDVVIEGILGTSDYESFPPHRGKVLNHITYCLARSPYVELNLETTGGLNDAKWFSVSDLESLRMYDNVVQMCAKAITQIYSQKEITT